jgi:hypothetical protein
MDLTPSPEKKTLYEGPKLSKSAAGRSMPGARRGGPPVFLLTVLVSAAGAAYYFWSHPEVTPQDALAKLGAGWQTVRAEIERRMGRAPEPASRRMADGRRRTKNPDDPSQEGKPAEPPKPAMSVTSLPEPEVPAERRTVLYLKNGERISGELVSESAGSVVLRWGAGDVEFNRSEIVQITRPSAAAPDEPAPVETPAPAAAGREVTLYLKNGGVVTGLLVHELPGEVILKFDYGEVSFSRAEINRIIGDSH